MSDIKSNLKEAAGYTEEETGEAFNDQKMADKGRELRNEGRVEKGEQPMTTPPGTTKSQ